MSPTTRTVNVEPDWVAMFENAVIQVEAVVAKDDMQAFIVEMLEFGKRLYTDSQTCGFHFFIDAKAERNGKQPE